MEDVCDNLFNADPYYQQGGDMVRVGGMTYAVDPTAKMGSRISDMRLGGKLIDASKKYKVAGWAPVAEEARNAGNKMVWELVEQWLKAQQGGKVGARKLNAPKVTGVVPNPGYVV
jgi:sulfur-oxidizing protein SoxB